MVSILFAQNTSQLQNKKVGGTVLGSGLQSIDYAYNIRGWMTKINDPNNMGSDLFGYELKYNNPNSTYAFPPKFNGNIAEIDWRKNHTDQESVLRRYSYSYDGVNRLSQAIFSEPNSTVPHNEFYNEAAEYDANGNITWLARNAPAFDGTSANQIDDLNYEYQGNKLLTVSDNTGNSTGYEGGGNSIDYDYNGNMVTMLDKKIDQIDYNILNLPTQLKINSNHKNVSYLYRADGTKLRKNFIAIGDNAQNYVSSVEYLDGFQYASSNGDELWALFQEMGGGAYENEAYAAFLNVYDYENVLKFVPTSEGFYDFENNQYIYQYKDHLGNARLSYKKEGTGLAVTDSNDYYAFGMSFVRNEEEEAQFGTGSYANYKYNGKELQETGMIDYGWRQYMSDIGRWNGIDQLAETYLSTSTYAYVANNPVMRFDVDGRWFNEDGSIGQSPATWDMHGSKYKPHLSFNVSDGVNVNSGGGDRGSLTVGDLSPDNGVTLGDLIDAWVSSNSTNYFEGIDFTQFGNDEEPVNFFSSTEISTFHMVFEEALKKYINTKGDGIFRVFGHGNVGLIQDENTKIVTADKFDIQMSKKNKNWSKVDSLKNSVLILYTCMSGSELNGETSIARLISQKHTNTLVIGFDGYASYGKNAISGKGAVQRVDLSLEYPDQFGSAVFYKNGKEINRMPFNYFQLLKY